MAIPETPVQPPTPKGKGGMYAIISVIAAVVIIGGIIGAVVINNNKIAQQHANEAATSTAAVANTANAQTATYAHQATVAATYPFSDKILLKDPLTDNSKGEGWDTDASFCKFTAGSYQTYDDQADTYSQCVATNTNFTDFTFEVQMTIKGGKQSGGGLFFRGNSQTDKFYYAYVYSDASYYVGVSVDNTGTNKRVLQSGTVTNFRQGLQQTNLVSVVAKGSTISLYVNKTLVTTVTDATYTGGQIGLFAVSYTDTSTVAYNNLVVYGL